MPNGKTIQADKECLLVSGAAGFIGSHLVEALLKLGWRVIGLDNFDPTYDRSLKAANLRPALEHERFAFYEGDIRDRGFLAEIVRRHRPRAALHLAARVGAACCLRDPVSALEINVAGSRNLAAALGYCKAGLIMVSSASVYGRRNAGLCREDQDLPESDNPYVAGKQQAEKAVLAEAAGRKIKVLILRLASTYGPRQRPGTALPVFCSSLLRGGPVPLFAPEHEMINVSDAVRGLVSALENLQENDIVNIGIGRPLKMNRVIGLLARALGVEAEVQERQAPPSCLEIGVLSIAKARRKWGFRAGVAPETGLAEYANWYLKNQEEYSK